MISLERRIGSREVLSIEFSIEPQLDKPVNEWWGHIRFWAGGRCIGNPDEIEMVSIGLGALEAVGKQTGSRASPLLMRLPPDAAIDRVMQAIYGEEEAETERVSFDDMTKFEVFPGASPFFDNWEAILLEEGDHEKFLYRHVRQPAQEMTWEIGTFRNITARANFELTVLQGQSTFQLGIQ